ncbi:hypothetical protein KPH14_005189 [Odynerus spinipes]|uniref:Uncharacterized protein n=1 Tax=Odynerus spinipes TaxID=1348599 RepID=A0AAD9RKM9_9HYME|nr:hypothetical protein KPH14_005189 [Odynerus spinipes]
MKFIERIRSLVFSERSSTIGPAVISSINSIQLEIGKLSLHENKLRLELYLPYAPLPGGGEILPAVSTGAASGGCRPVLLGGIDLSMSAAVEPVPTLPTLPTTGLPAHNPLHHPPGGLALPPLASASVMMPRPPPGTMPPLGPASLPQAHQDAGDLADTPPNPDVLLALLARNKNLEARRSKNQEKRFTRGKSQERAVESHPVNYRGTVLTHHHQGTIKAIIAGLMVSPMTRPPPQLTMKYSEVYNGSAISRNTRGLWKP